MKLRMSEACLAVDLLLLCLWCGVCALSSTAAPGLAPAGLGAPLPGPDPAAVPRGRRRRSISQEDMLAILHYHNKVRAKVFPPASNMEYMVREKSLSCRF